MRLSAENHELLSLFFKDFIINTWRRQQREVIGGSSTLLNSQRQPKDPKYSLQQFEFLMQRKNPQGFSPAIRILEAAKQLKEECTQSLFTWSQVDSITIFKGDVGSCLVE